MDQLEVLGAPPDAARVYGHLVEQGPAGIDRVAEALSLSPSAAREAVSSLKSLGLVVWIGDEATATSPRSALEGVAADHTARATAARTAAADLEQLWGLHQGRADYLEVVPSIAAAHAVQQRILRGSTQQVRALSIGSEKQPRIAEGLAAALDAGVRVRAVYGAQVLHHPVAMKVVGECIALGQETRVFPKIPMNLLISDAKLAMLVVRVPSARRADALVVHPSDLFDTIVGVFDAFWGLATPVARASGDDQMVPDSPDALRLLANLAAGLTDQAIATDLDVSERTVRRRISQLQAQLGAQTRFQLGIQVVRHGWL